MKKYSAKTKIRKKYTRVVKMGSTFNAYMQVNHQGFCVVENVTKKRAEWYSKMLASALLSLIEENQPQKK